MGGKRLEVRHCVLEEAYMSIILLPSAVAIKALSQLGT